MFREKLIELEVPCETILKLSVYVEFLLKWNKKINLISKNTVPDVWMRHIVDCAQLIKFIKNDEFPIVDLGSGAGLPGVVLSILGIRGMVLVESDMRKVSFLKEVTRILDLNLSIINDRTENISLECKMLVARGFSSLDGIFAANIKTNRMLLLKGRNIESEIEEASKNWEFCYKKSQSIASSESYVLDITNVRRKKS